MFSQSRLSATWAYVTSMVLSPFGAPFSTIYFLKIFLLRNEPLLTHISHFPALLPSSKSSAKKPSPQCDASHPTQDSVSLPRPMSPMLPEPVEDNTIHYSQRCASPAPSGPSTTGESDASGRSTAPFIATVPPVGSEITISSVRAPGPSSSSSLSPSPTSSSSPFPPMPVAVTQLEQPADVPMVSFEDFAFCYRQNLHKQSQRKRLEHRLHATKVSLAVSARLIRVGAAVQRGLVESLKQDDKINFVNLYHALHELQESCEAAARRPFHHRQDPLLEEAAAGDLDSALDRPSDFFRQLSPQSQSDLLDILHSVRTDPDFLFDRLRSLTTAQLTTLVSSTTTLEAHDLASPSTSRSRTYPFSTSSASTSTSTTTTTSSSSASSFSSKRVSSASPFQDYALACERTDPLATLLFNVFAAPLDADSPEARLRVDVWSSVCAKLITHGGSRYYPLVGHILSAWALCSDWKARPQFELYLMDTLQTGAFLLEHIGAPAGVDTDPIDPLKTNVAEEFFASAVDSLFILLDDTDAGLPHAVMELGSAILEKLDHTDLRNRFLEYLFVHWFFSNFLYGALIYPEVCLYPSFGLINLRCHKTEITECLFFLLLFVSCYRLMVFCSTSIFKKMHERNCWAKSDYKLIRKRLPYFGQCECRFPTRTFVLFLRLTVISTIGTIMRCLIPQSSSMSTACSVGSRAWLPA